MFKIMLKIMLKFMLKIMLKIIKIIKLYFFIVTIYRIMYNNKKYYVKQNIKGGFIFSKPLKLLTDAKYKHGLKEFNFIRQKNMPTNEILHMIISNAYNKVADESINDMKNDGWDIIKPYTETIKPYLNESTKTIVLGVRGTADFKDVLADLKIATNNLKGSKRFNNDLDFIKKLQKIYNPNEYTYYAVGHSLGGAIVDELLNQNLIKQGISYNPAVEDKYLNNKNHLRIYNEGDMLFNIMGKYSSNQEVRKNPKSFFKRLLGLTELTKAGQGIYYHLLNNFKGGLLFGGWLKDSLNDIIYGSGK